MKDTGHVTEKLTLIFFFDFLGVFHRLCINIRIEVHFCSFASGNETLVACKSLRSASQDLHVTSVLSFPHANEKSVLQSFSKVFCST